MNGTMIAGTSAVVGYIFLLLAKKLRHTKYNYPLSTPSNSRRGGHHFANKNRILRRSDESLRVPRLCFLCASPQPFTLRPLCVYFPLGTTYGGSNCVFYAKNRVFYTRLHLGDSLFHAFASAVSFTLTAVIFGITNQSVLHSGLLELDKKPLLYTPLSKNKGVAYERKI